MDFWEQALEQQPFMRFLNIEALDMGPEYVVLQLRARQEIANHTGGLHAGAQFTLGETTAVAAVSLSIGLPLDTFVVVTARASITYQRPSQGDLTARARLLSEQRTELQTTLSSVRKVRLSIPVEIADASGLVVTGLDVACVVFPR